MTNDAKMQDTPERREERKNSFLNRRQRRKIAKKHGVFKVPREQGWRHMGANKPAPNVQTIKNEEDQSNGKNRIKA